MKAPIRVQEVIRLLSHGAKLCKVWYYCNYYGHKHASARGARECMWGWQVERSK